LFVQPTVTDLATPLHRYYGCSQSGVDRTAPNLGRKLVQSGKNTKFKQISNTMLRLETTAVRRRLWPSDGGQISRFLPCCIMLRWPRNLTQFEFSPSSAWYLTSTHFFSVAFENIVDHKSYRGLLPITRFDGLHFRRRQYLSNFNHCDVLARKYTKFGEIKLNSGHYAVQGHSRSSISVPNESP